MKSALRCLAATAALLLCLPALARDITGVWTVDPPSPEGVIRYETLTIEGHPGAFTGVLDSLPSEGHPVKLQSVQLTGDALSLVAIHPDENGGPGHEARWEGRLLGEDALQMTRQFEHEHPEQVTLKHR